MLVDPDVTHTSSQYGLTGAVFAQDESAIVHADGVLRYSAGDYRPAHRRRGRSATLR